MSTSPDYYEALQVSPAADPEVIEAAYRRLVEKWQAERQPGDPAASARLAALDAAYAVLTDPAKRQRHDTERRGRAEAAPAPNAPPPGQASPPTAEDAAADPAASVNTGGGQGLLLLSLGIVFSTVLAVGWFALKGKPPAGGHAASASPDNPFDSAMGAGQPTAAAPDPSLGWVEQVVPGASGKPHPSLAINAGGVGPTDPASAPNPAWDDKSLPEADRAVSYLRAFAPQFLNAKTADEMYGLSQTVFREFRRRFPDLKVPAIRQQFEANVKRQAGDSPVGTLMAAVEHLRQGQEWSGKLKREDAVLEFTEAIRLDPKFTQAYLARGRVNKLPRGDYD